MSAPFRTPHDLTWCRCGSLVPQDGKIIYSGAAGTASLGSGRAVTPDVGGH